PLERPFLRVEAQPGLASLGVRPVAVVAVVGEDRQHVAREVHLLSRPELSRDGHDGGQAEPECGGTARRCPDGRWHGGRRVRSSGGPEDSCYGKGLPGVESTPAVASEAKACTALSSRQWRPTASSGTTVACPGTCRAT